uniref:Uncharacterized protein n=1 Tax=Chenopodium quinoa TaxID=63459 RepID=A0A803MCN5_CHEQI
MFGRAESLQPQPQLYSDNSFEHHQYEHRSSTIDSTNSSPSENTGCASPYSKSPWSAHMALPTSMLEGSLSNNGGYYNCLMGSLIREEGHIYSLATSGDLLYTGTDSKNIRVWRNQREYSGFKSNSGLVKSIVISEDKIFTGHQDGKIRVWKMCAKNPSVHKRVGTLPTFKSFMKKSIRPKNYIEIGRHRNALWIRHYDAISSLSLSEDRNYLYSASWDKTVKVWRTSNFKCLESIPAHDDAVNAVVAGFDGLVFTGSADGTIKVWRREVQGKGTKHFFSQSLLKQECAVTALAIDPTTTILYCGSSNGQVNFWEKQNFAYPCGTLNGHKLAVLCLATAGCLVFSGSADMNICVWKRVTNEDTNIDDHICLSILTGHNGPVKCLAVVPSGETSSFDSRWVLYSGSLDKSIKIWRILEEVPDSIVAFTRNNTRQHGSLSFAFR